MNEAVDESLETTAVLSVAGQAKPLIAWRSLSISVLIAIVTEVVLVVALTHLHIRLYDAPQWQNDVLDWVMEHHGVLPICAGGLYLAFKVQHRWMLQSSIYITLFALLAIIPLVSRDYEAAVYLLFRIALCYLVISLTQLMASKYFASANSSRVDSEKLRFGFATVFWGSTLVALLVSLMIWTGKAFIASFDERMKNGTLSRHNGRKNILSC